MICHEKDLLARVTQLEAERQQQLLDRQELLAERKRAEDALRLANQLCEKLLDHLTDLFAAFDSEWRYVYANGSLLRQLGLNREQVVGQCLFELFPEAAAVMGPDHRLMQVAADGQPRVWTEHGAVTGRWMENRAFPWARGVAVISRDVTERLRTEEVLRRSEERLRLVQTAAHVGVWEWDMRTGNTECAAEVERLFGYAEGTFPGHYQAFSERVHPDDLERVERIRDDAVRAHEPFDFDFRVLPPSGATIWLNCRGAAAYDEAGNPVRVFGINADITAVKATEDRLAAERADLERLHLLSDRLISQEALPTLLQATVDAAIDLTHAQMGTLQLDDEASGSLRMVAHRGFQPPFLDRFSVVHEGLTVGGEIIEDVGTSPRFRGTPSMAVMRAAGVCALQSTPLQSCDGRLLGTIATYWTEPHRPEESTLRLLDLLAREAANLIEHRRREERLRAKEAELELVLDSTPFMLVRCSRDLRYRYVSRAFAAMIGRTPEELAGRPIVEVIGEQGWAAIRPRVEAVLRGQRVEYEDDVPLTGAGTRRVDVVYVPDRDEEGQVIGWIASIMDVTERRETEAALRVAHARLLEADRHRTQFLSMLSHELRNPLTPIRNSLFILERAAPGGEQASRAREIIARQVTHLARLVDDLLDVTRIVSGKLQVRRVRFDLNQMVMRTAEDHRMLFADAGIGFEVRPCPGPLWMNGDETRLAQALGNVLGNAAKFTEQGGRVTLDLAVDVPAQMAVIGVQDTGIGVHPELACQLFEPFVQADTTLDRSRGGLGLGLARVKSVVELHGGTVAVRSEGPGRGTEFVLRLPVELQAVLALGRQKRPSSPPPPRRVLVIEDNRDAADSLRDALSMGEHQVAVAYGGREGLELARQFRPDVVFCDIGLPGMSGYEVARAFRADEALGSAHLVALTGYALPEDQQRAAEAGFTTHVAKPPDLEEIEKLLADLPSSAAG